MEQFTLHKLHGDRLVVGFLLKLATVLFVFLYTVLSCSVLTWLLPLALGAGLYYYVNMISLPPGDELLVREALGVEPFPLNETGQDKNDFRMKVVGHRFGALDAPENTMAALEQCKKNGCMAVEFDICITSDKKLVVFHDDTLERMTNIPGRVDKATWKELASMDVSVNHPFSEQFKSARIPLFEDVIKKCLDYDMRMFIDIKHTNKEVLEGVCKMYEQYPMLYRRAVISSFDPRIVYQIRKRKPSVVGCLAWRPLLVSCLCYNAENEVILPSDRRFSSPILHFFGRIGDYFHRIFFFNIVYHIVGISGILIHKDALCKEVIQWWNQRNVRCIAWTVNQPSEKQHFAKNLRVTYMTDTLQADCD